MKIIFIVALITKDIFYFTDHYHRDHSNSSSLAWDMWESCSLADSELYGHQLVWPWSTVETSGCAVLSWCVTQLWKDCHSVDRVILHVSNQSSEPCTFVNQKNISWSCMNVMCEVVWLCSGTNRIYFRMHTNKCCYCVTRNNGDLSVSVSIAIVKSIMSSTLII